MSEPADEPTDGLDTIDSALRTGGRRLRRQVRVETDVRDLRARSERQRRRLQLTTATAAMALILGAGVVAVAAGGPTGGDVQLGDGPGGDGTGGRAAAPGNASGQLASTTTTTGSPATSRRPPAAAAPGGSTGPGSAPPSTPPAPDNGSGSPTRIRDVDFRDGFPYAADDCGAGAATGAMTVHNGAYTAEGSVRLKVDAVVYGTLLGDGSEQAVVTITCPGNGGARALVFSADPSAAGGARRVARVEPDPLGREVLARQGILGWRLGEVRVEGASVVSDWTAYRNDQASAAPAGRFTLTQRLRSGAWEQAGPPQITPAGGR